MILQIGLTRRSISSCRYITAAARLGFDGFSSYVVVTSAEWKMQSFPDTGFFNSDEIKWKI
jgi:hypothetical protein